MGRGMSNWAALAVLAAGSAQAGGIDRSGQPVSVLFEEGNYLELSYGQVSPDVKGNDLAIYGGRATTDVAGTHQLPGLAAKYQFSDKVSGALILDQAYGADIYYPLATAGGSLMLGGTSAQVDSQGFTLLGRYKFTDAWSVHGGLRATKASGEVRLQGLAYSTLSTYNASLADSWGTGFVLGGAYEIPDIKARVALTYFSKITHDFDTTERFGSTVIGQSVTAVDTPEAVNLDFQTGIMKDTLLFGSMRWANWDKFLIQPTVFKARTGGASITKLDDTMTYTLGVGRKFNDTWSGSVFATWENMGGDDLVSPLSPTNGYKGMGLAAVYTKDAIKVTMGVRVLDLGDASAATSETARATVADNRATAVGIKLGYRF